MKTAFLFGSALVALVWALLIMEPCLAHTALPTRPSVIFDTDAALDDLRALALLIQSDEADLLAVVTSDGSSSPLVGAENLRQVLAFYGRLDVPIIAGIDLHAPPPPWRRLSESLGGAELPTKLDGRKHIVPIDSLNSVLLQSVEPVTYICAGPLTNLAHLLRQFPRFKNRLAAVYYQGNTPDANHPSWNTMRDTAAARSVFGAGLPLRAFDIVDTVLLYYDSSMAAIACAGQNLTARLLCLLHAGPDVQTMVKQKHFRAWDESVILGMLDPSLLNPPVPTPTTTTSVFRSWDREAARQLYVELLTHDDHEGVAHAEAVVFNNFPSDPAMFLADLCPHVNAIVNRHGTVEWRAAVLTNELHGHLGVFSLVGVKMGVRARELLGAEIDELRVVSYAGSAPPLSCLNDGLQVATGATLGRGSIELKDSNPRPSALFSLGQKSIRLTLKQDVLDRIQQDLRLAIEQYGDLTPMYFDAVRKIAIKHWLELHRKDIFESDSQ